MIGWLVAWKCLVACLLGESSQQPTWPQLRQIRKCSHTLPLSKHSSQPSALGVTSRMPAMWVQPFAMTGSHLAGVEEDHVDTSGGECRHVGRRGLTFRAGEGRFHSCQVIESQYCDQMKAG